jgi:hypothetical protein
VPDQQQKHYFDSARGEKLDIIQWWKDMILNHFGVTISDDGGKKWGATNLSLVLRSLAHINSALNGRLKSLAGGATFRLGEYELDPATCPNLNCTYGGVTSGTIVTFNTDGDDAIRQMNIYHEFGHVLDNSPGLVNAFSGALDSLPNPSFVQGSNGENPGFLDPSALVASSVSDPYHSTADALQHPSTDPVEQWADAFANYVAGNIDLEDPAGQAMYDFVTGALRPYIGAP